MIDLFCGVGGWATGGLSEGYEVVGFDIERHRYPEQAAPEGNLRQPNVNWNRYGQTGGAEKSTPDWQRQATKRPLTGRWIEYPGELVLQDVLTLHGSQFRDAALIVASPPCQEYSYMAMPWSRAKAKAAAIRADTTGQMLADLNRLFDACFRIQAQASLAAGRHVPMVVENVRGAQPWVGRARWNFGSFYLWGDVPALMPFTASRGVMKPQPYERRHGTGSWFAIDMKSSRAGITSPAEIGQKVPGFRFDGSGRSFQSAAVKGVGPTGGAHGMTRWTNPAEGFKSAGMNWSDRSLRGQDFTRIAGNQAVKVPGGGADGWFGANDHPLRQHTRGHPARKAASAMIAKIPLPLATWIARAYRT
jgi:hypothetical protein